MKVLVILFSALGMVLAIGGVSKAQITLPKAPQTIAPVQKTVQAPELKIVVYIANTQDSRVQVTTQQSDKLKQVANLLTAGENGEATELWGQLMVALDQSGRAHDINALIQWVLRSAYLENTQDLRYYADKVRYFNSLKKSIRSYIRRVREYASEISDINDEPTINELIAGLNVEMEKARIAEHDAQTIFVSAAAKQPQLLQQITLSMKTLREISDDIALKEHNFPFICRRQ